MGYPKGWPRCSHFRCGRKCTVIVSQRSATNKWGEGYCAEHAAMYAPPKGGTT